MASLPRCQRPERIQFVYPETSKDYPIMRDTTSSLNYFDPYIPSVPIAHGFIPNEGAYQSGSHHPRYLLTPTTYPVYMNGFSSESTMGRPDQSSGLPLHYHGANVNPFTRDDLRGNLFMNLPVSAMTASMIPRPEPNIVSATVPAAVVRPMPRGHKFECEGCHRTFDRYSRLENCHNRHLGVEPHKCLGRCGSPGCPKEYASIDHLDRHINPYGICTLCGENHLKQNMSRHRAVCGGH